MATIANNKKYSQGHEIILKQVGKIPISTGAKFAAAGYTLGKSVFSIVMPTGKTKAHKLIELAFGNAQVYLKDADNKIVLVRGSVSSINGSFNHYSNTAKSNTNVLTEIKENTSMMMFESAIERGKYLSEDDIINKLGNLEEYYNTTFYDSSVKQAVKLKSYIKSSNRGYTYERQNQDLTRKIYDNARKLSKKANDNWNPADVWMIKPGYNIKRLYMIDNIMELNETILIAIKNQDIIPISLKQVTNTAAKLTLIDPTEMQASKIDLDLSLKSVALSETFNNFIIETQSGFSIRGGFKASSSTLNVSLEGRFIGAGFQVGAVDAKAYKAHVQNTYGYSVRGSSNVPESDHKLALSEMERMFAKYGRISKKLENFKAAKDAFDIGDELLKDRFSNITSYLASFLLAPQTKEAFEENMKRCYFLSKKITNDSCAYVLIE